MASYNISVHEFSTRSPTCSYQNTVFIELIIFRVQTNIFCQLCFSTRT